MCLALQTVFYQSVFRSGAGHGVYLATMGQLDDGTISVLLWRADGWTQVFSKAPPLSDGRISVHLQKAILPVLLVGQ